MEKKGRTLSGRAIRFNLAPNGQTIAHNGLVTAPINRNKDFYFYPSRSYFRIKGIGVFSHFVRSAP